MTRSTLITRWGQTWLGILFLTLFTLGASAPAPKRVLILNPFGRDVAPFSSAVSSFRTTLAQELGEPVDIYEIPLDLARFDGTDGEGPLVAFLQDRIKSQPVDLVVPIAGVGAQFAARHREPLFPNTPVLVVAAEPRMLPPGFLQTNATLVTQQANLPGMVEDILQVQPQTTNIVVVFGVSPLERFWVKECRREFQAFTNRVGFTWLDELSLGQVLERCAALPPRSFILNPLFVVDAAGVPGENNVALRRLHEVANAPLFGYFASEFGLGPIGGRLFQDTEIGAQGARTAIQILRGERPHNIPPKIFEPATPVYDWRELKRWGISEARLAAGSIVQFRQPGFWELYRWPIIGTILICFLQASLIIGLLVNRAKRKRADERFRLTVEASPSGIVLVDHQRRIVLVNRQAERLFGYSRGELVGQTLEMLLPERFRGAHPGHVNGFFAAPQSRATGAGRELFGRRKDGTEFSVEIGLNPIESAQGTFVLTAIVDITARRKAEAETLQQRNELAHLSRVATVSELSGSLAHELNQPLAIILTNAQAAQRLLAQQPPDLAEARDILADIISEDQRAGEVIRRLRAMLKHGETNLQPQDANETIEEVLQITRNDLIRQSVTVQRNLVGNLPPVLGDRIQLQQVLINLILNACDAMASIPPADRQLALATSLHEGAIRISVSDNGCGLPPETEKIFQPFFTTKKHGLGLGLSICRSIVQAHQGRLRAETRGATNGGATLHLELPAAAEASP